MASKHVVDVAMRRRDLDDDHNATWRELIVQPELGGTRIIVRSDTKRNAVKAACIQLFGAGQWVIVWDPTPAEKHRFRVMRNVRSKPDLIDCRMTMLVREIPKEVLP